MNNKSNIGIDKIIFPQFFEFLNLDEFLLIYTCIQFEYYFIYVKFNQII